MALLATFIGINKYSDPNISDLTGAARDALALWSIFSDSLPNFHPQLLLDEEATLTEIRKALDTTLGAATQDDTAMFFFAGHGTSSHQLVPYNARLEDIANTTLPMDELAQRLSSSKARVTIVFLDCCFSGGATARVLQNIPTPRGNLITVANLQGKGRVIIAASKDDQSAYELRGHGLLTQALLHTFKNSPHGTDIGAVMDEVTKWVRAEAGRFGWDQTPVIFNLVEGGLKFPPLQPGPLYAQFFPDTTGIHVSNNVQDLTLFGLPSAVLDVWAKRFPNGLNNLQLKAINDYRILDSKSLLVIAPTSSGKTFIGEMSAAKAIVEGKKAVFLFPFRSLTNEKYEDFSALYGTHLNLRIVRCTGDYADDTGHFVRGKYDIALLTYEMFLGLSTASPSLLSKIGLVVLDEAQFITDTQRGISVELLLTNILAAREKGVEPQIVALSAVIGAVNHFDAWLGCETLFTHDRPVPLIEGVLDRSGMFQYLGLDGQTQLEQVLSPHTIVQRKKKPSYGDVILPLVKKLVSEKERILIFRNQRGSAVGCAIYLANELGLPPANDAIARLPERDLSATSLGLRKALRGGTALHNSDLIREERLVVEQTFREPEGSIHILAATTTVAAGINTPASTVIIAETFFYGEKNRNFTVAEYKNMAGRAGRVGFSEQGRCVLLAANATEREHLFQMYVRGEPEPIVSSFDPSDLETWILRLLTQVERLPRKDVVRLLASTYGGYLASRQHPDWHMRMEAYLEGLLETMETLGLTEQEDGLLQLSLLGKACGRSSFSFKSAMKLVELLKHLSSQVTAEQLMAYLQAIPEVGGYTSIYKRNTQESAWQRHVTLHYGEEVTRTLQRKVKDQFDYYARCKRAAILWDWIHGEGVELIEKTFSVTPFGGSVGAGDIRGYADRTRLYLRSAFNIADILLLGTGPNEDTIDLLLKQLEFGLPAGALKLIDLPISLTRGEYLALFRAGYTTPESVLALSKEDLLQSVGNLGADQLIVGKKNPSLE